ncbi:MAG TPA: type 4a pilus biogenesis protein PilO [Nitrospiraceae bacterium]|nr:type 4a pilus biogenesis protein PilO [Nitrospiraceae bacterium]
MELPKVNLEFLRTIPVVQKVALLGIVVAGIAVGFYYYVAIPKSERIAQLQTEIGALDGKIRDMTNKVKNLDALIAANKQLEAELARKKEKLPPEEEAHSLLKQLSDLGVKLGLDIKLWKPGAQSLDGSKQFVRMPVSVEVAGGYHTAALFFDRIHRLPRIISVSNLIMGSPKIEQERVVIQTVFELTAFVAPPEVKPSGPSAGAKK